MSFSETIFLFFLALIIFGPKKLPEIARQVGRALNEFRRASNEFKAQIEQEISRLEDETPRQQILPPSRVPEGAVASGSQNATVVEAEAPATSAAGSGNETQAPTNGHALTEGAAVEGTSTAIPAPAEIAAKPAPAASALENAPETLPAAQGPHA